MSTTLAPRDAAVVAPTIPAGPAPITARSYIFRMVITAPKLPFNLHQTSVGSTPKTSHKRDADTGVNRMSSTSQSSASHHNSAVLAEVISTTGMDVETPLTRSTRSLQLPSAKASSVTIAGASDPESSKSVAAL